MLVTNKININDLKHFVNVTHLVALVDGSTKRLNMKCIILGDKQIHSSFVVETVAGIIHEGIDVTKAVEIYNNAT